MNEQSAKRVSVRLSVVVVAVVLGAPAPLAAKTIGTANSVHPDKSSYEINTPTSTLGLTSGAINFCQAGKRQIVVAGQTATDGSGDSSQYGANSMQFAQSSPTPAPPPPTYAPPTSDGCENTSCGTRH